MKQQKYETLSIIVECGNMYRVFETQRFLIHPILQHLQRYSPNHHILCLVHGAVQMERLNNECWNEHDKQTIDKILSTLPKLWSAGQQISKQKLLEDYSYRIAINIAHIQDDANGIYPSLKQFTNVKVCRPSNVKTDELPPFPIFISNDDNLLDNAEDILKFYEGKKIQRYYRGEPVQGFVLTKARFE